MSKLPKHPVFVPTKARAENATTPTVLANEGIQTTLFVESLDVEPYSKAFPECPIVELPDKDRGVAYARQFVLDYARSQGIERFCRVSRGSGSWTTISPDSAEWRT